MPQERQTWSLGQIDGILALAEAGRLSQEELARAAALHPLAPEAAAWRRAAEGLLVFAGVALLASGLIFFFAYNWADLHRFAKLGLAWSALAASVAAALFLQPRGVAYRAVLLGAALATGGLLALIGQTYQTGADLWQLFAAWLALMTPFALLARSSANWLVWVLLANLSLGRFLDKGLWHGLFISLGMGDTLLLFAALNLVLLLFAETFTQRLLLVPRRHLHRLLALGWIGPLATGAGLGWWETDMEPHLTALVVAGGLAFWFYRFQRRDVPILAMLIFAAIAVVGLGLSHLLPNDFLSFNFIALYLIAATGYAAVWLLRLLRQGKAPESDTPKEDGQRKEGTPGRGAS